MCGGFSCCIACPVKWSQFTISGAKRLIFRINQLLRKTIAGLLATSLFLLTTPVHAQASDIDQSIRTNWEFFTDHCGQFLDDPNGLFTPHSEQGIKEWPWLIRSAEISGYFEYFSVSPDQNKQFTAIQTVSVIENHLHCSLSISPAGAISKDVLGKQVLSFFGQYPSLEVSAEEISFQSASDDAEYLKQYYSTAFFLRIVGAFDRHNKPVFIRIDDGGSLYFEVETTTQ